MFDLHTHSLFSDGVLSPLELIRHAHVKGYKTVAVTDHADPSNLKLIIPPIVEACRTANKYWDIKAIPGVEITHVPLEIIAELAIKSRRLGAKLIIAHGETLAEPVIPGTNRKALEADIDILAHPGLISPEDARIAQENNIFLEITTRKGHSLSNGHVAKTATACGAGLVLNNDAHAPEDLLSHQQRINIARGAGLNEEQIQQLWENSRALVKRYR